MLKLKLYGLSPLANYTDRPTAADSRRSDCQLCGYRVPRGQREGSLWPYYRFSRQEPLLFYQVAPQLYLRVWVDPVPDTLLLRKSGSAGNRTRASGSVARTLTSRQQRRSLSNAKRYFSPSAQLLSQNSLPILNAKHLLILRPHSSSMLSTYRW
jgi:hypothetical protein